MSIELRRAALVLCALVLAVPCRAAPDEAARLVEVYSRHSCLLDLVVARGKACAPHLLERLQDPEVPPLDVCKALARIGGKEVKAGLTPHLGAPVEPRRNALAIAAACTLSGLEVRQGTEALQRLLAHDDRKVVAKALRFAAELELPQPKPITARVRELTRAPEDWVRAPAWTLLAALAPKEARATWERALQDESPEVRLRALTALDGPAEELERLAADPALEAGVRMGALDQLQQRPGPGTEAVLWAIFSAAPDQQVSRHAGQTLGLVGGPATLERVGAGETPLQRGEQELAHVLTGLEADRWKSRAQLREWIGGGGQPVEPARRMALLIARQVRIAGFFADATGHGLTVEEVCRLFLGRLPGVTLAIDPAVDRTREVPAAALPGAPRGEDHLAAALRPFQAAYRVEGVTVRVVPAEGEGR